MEMHKIKQHIEKKNNEISDCNLNKNSKTNLKTNSKTNSKHHTIFNRNQLDRSEMTKDVLRKIRRFIATIFVFTGGSLASPIVDTINASCRSYNAYDFNSSVKELNKISKEFEKLHKNKFAFAADDILVFTERIKDRKRFLISKLKEYEKVNINNETRENIKKELNKINMYLLNKKLCRINLLKIKTLTTESGILGAKAATALIPGSHIAKLSLQGILLAGLVFFKLDTLFNPYFTSFMNDNGNGKDDNLKKAYEIKAEKYADKILEIYIDGKKSNDEKELNISKVFVRATGVREKEFYKNENDILKQKKLLYNAILSRSAY